MDKTVEVYLLSGFLGSGKTTLLKRLVEDAKSKGLKPAVLMNEAGEVNLDALVLDASVPMAEMLGGCICCSIRADVGMELLQLVERHSPDVVWIESTGVAKPLEIIDAVSDVSMYAKVELRDNITVVDARHLLDRVRIGSGKTLKLMIEQIRASSLIVLNKTDLVGEDERNELIEWLSEWNASAQVVPAVRCEFDLSLVGSRRHECDRIGKEPDRRDHHDHGHSHIGTLTCYLDGPLDSRAFEQWMRALPEGVYRAKGIVTFRDTASRFLFQYAYRALDFMRIAPQKTVHDVAVFIGDDIPAERLKRELAELTLAALS
ncbi:MULTISPECIES: CobW family GTP-binding protein [Cohnella]|uniref:CobW family GTP-binding protein n=1 Tax=Cohnella TaxID=329857 RepID=UPI00037E9D4B|nr:MULTISPECIES: GTP-binding protein [Cohnella]REK68737.1 MAG: GTP-binding protein [Cohnella sp.]